MLENLESCLERFHTIRKVLPECCCCDDLQFHNISDFEQILHTEQPHQIESGGPRIEFATDFSVVEANGQLAKPNALQTFQTQQSFFDARKGAIGRSKKIFLGLKSRLVTHATACPRGKCPNAYILH